MSDLNERLRESDPLRHEPGLASGDVERMRRAMMAAAHSARTARRGWPRPFGIVAVAVLALAIGMVATRRSPSEPAERRVAGSAPSGASAQRTQVHFSTPGGTRIVWTLDPEFQLKETRR